jgi:hypothetical protein
MECPARNAAVEPNFLHRDLPDISVKVMHLNEGAAYRERHLPTVAHYEVVTNPFPAARGTDGDEGGADRDEPQTHEPKVPRMSQRSGMSPEPVERQLRGVAIRSRFPSGSLTSHSRPASPSSSTGMPNSAATASMLLT